MATAGQPTKYSKAKLEKAIDYITNYADYEDVIPSVAGLAVVLEVSKKTLYNWAEVEENSEFLHALSRLATNQERRLLNGGLSGSYNPTITKLILTNHGYSDKPREDIDDEDAPPLDINFDVKLPVSEIKTTNAKP